MGVIRGLAGRQRTRPRLHLLESHSLHIHYAYAITAPYFINQCLVLLIYWVLCITVIKGHTRVLSSIVSRFGRIGIEAYKMFHTYLANMLKTETISPFPLPVSSVMYGRFVHSLAQTLRLCWSESVPKSVQNRYHAITRIGTLNSADTALRCCHSFSYALLCMWNTTNIAIRFAIECKPYRHYLFTQY